MSNPESPSDYSILYQRAREEWDERLGSGETGARLENVRFFRCLSPRLP